MSLDLHRPWARGIGRASALLAAVWPPPFARLQSLADRADSMQRICAAFDFGVFPEETDWVTFAGWRDVFDRFPVPDSPGYHAFRHWYGWDPVPVERRLGIPAWKVADLHASRSDPGEEMV